MKSRPRAPKRGASDPLRHAAHAGKVIVHNVPQILDVIQLIELLQAMGVEVERLSEESYSFRAADIDPDYLRSDDYCRRASRLRGR